jgi:NAD(P)-dependent dehydrogenase (short-subunit alcohol dehydrogenase family)
MSTTEVSALPRQRERQLTGQTVVLLGGSAGIGLETARLARAEGADVVLVGRNPDRLHEAALEVDARSTAAFDATDPEALGRFFHELPTAIDHVLVTAGGPHYGPLVELDFADARRTVEEHLWLPLQLGRMAVGKVRAGGSLVFMTGTGGRRSAVGLTVGGMLTVGSLALTRNLALELAPIRVNMIAAGFVDTPLSASLLGDQLEGLAARSCARHCRSGGSSSPRTSPRSPCTSWPTRHSPARRTTSTAASS